MEALDRTPTVPRRPRVLALVAVSGALALFLGVGLLGLYRYLDSFWLYRGFPPPHDPSFVQQAGTFETIHVTSRAVGGRSQRVVVYLPPGYAQDTSQRYPVLYLLHGFPGDPDGFVRTIRVGVVEDTLLAKRTLRPMILVMPMGSTGVFTDKEWGNGIGKDAGWETFLARDVVRAIDARYRTIRSGSARGLAGLSEGGYCGAQHRHSPSARVPLAGELVGLRAGRRRQVDLRRSRAGARSEQSAPDAAEGRTRAAGRARLRLDVHAAARTAC